jgi:hypothetical protein
MTKYADPIGSLPSQELERGASPILKAERAELSQVYGEELRTRMS